MKYDGFISYRRENGFLMAQVIHDRLLERGRILKSFVQVISMKLCMLL